MVPIHFTTGTSAPVLTQCGNFTEFWGLVGTNAEAYFVKMYWQGNTNAAIVIGTTAPNITIAVPASPTAVTDLVFSTPIILLGPMYDTVTKNAPDTDATALSTGGDVVTLFVG
jgi:hypothetical protein